MNTPDDNNKNRQWFPDSKTIQRLTDATWELARQMLWDKIPYSKEEILLIKIYIEEMISDAFKEHKNAIMLFSHIARRIENTKKIFKDIPKNLLPYPATWFNKRNPNGFISIKINHFGKVDITSLEEPDKSIVKIESPTFIEIHIQIYLS